MRPPVVTTTVTGMSGSDPRATPASCRLHVVHPPELRQVFALNDGEITLGRDPGPGGIRLDHGTVSRKHATLVWAGAHNAHALRDLGSRNGSKADGVSAAGTTRPLVNGSLLRLGDVLLIYEQEVAPVEEAPQVSREAAPGESFGMRRLRSLLARAAPDPAPVLIIGETGTGKERLAREVHRLSGRRGKLVALNCAALSAQIVESQLFGHAKGAFTGATEAQPGLFRAAHGGTLFLDEIGDLPLELQPKLLRTLQEGEVLPVGATQPVQVDVRVVAATHRDLARATQERTFREDLYARLALWELHVPALRERRVDLLDWVERLHQEWAAKRDVTGKLRFDADAAEALLGFAWPLNLRGIERLVHELGSATGRTIGRAALPPWLGTAPPAAAPAAPEREQPVPTRDEFAKAFDELDGSVHGLAKRFGRDRRQIYRWIEAHGLADRRPRTGKVTK